MNQQSGKLLVASTITLSICSGANCAITLLPQCRESQTVAVLPQRWTDEPDSEDTIPVMAAAALACGVFFVTSLVLTKRCGTKHNKVQHPKTKLDRSESEDANDGGLHVHVLELDGVVLGGITGDLPTYVRNRDLVSQNDWASNHTASFVGRLVGSTTNRCGYVKQAIVHNGCLVNVRKPVDHLQASILAQIGCSEVTEEEAA